jgi:hypothetical protein
VHVQQESQRAQGRRRDPLRRGHAGQVRLRALP